MQQFVDRYAQTLSSAESKENIVMKVLWTMNNVRNFIDATSNNLSDEALQADSFFEQCFAMVMDRASTMRPA